MCISTFTETEAETTELVLRDHKGDIGQEEERELGISLTYSAQCSVHGQPLLDTVCNEVWGIMEFPVW